MIKDIIKSEKIEMTYTCESAVNDIEFGKMIHCFKKMYWNYALYGMILNLIFTTLVIILLKTLIEAVIFFTVCQLFVMLIYKLRFRKIMRETLISHNKNKVIDAEFSNYFYENFFVRNGKDSSHKINYNEINIFIKTEDNIYLCAENKNLIVILQKDKCSENLINFLDKKYNKEKAKIEIFNYSVNNKKNWFMDKLFVITIFSLWGSLLTWGVFSAISNNGYGVDILKYICVMWFWLPIPILSIVLGIKYKIEGLKCTQNIVSGFIVVLIFLCLGSFSFIFKDLNDYTNSIFVITQDEHTDKINYYEVNYRYNTRTTKKFESEVDEIFVIDGCFERKRILSLDACRIEDEEENRIELTEDLKLILENVEKVQQDHAIFEIKILTIEDDYYVVISLNVNMWTPYELYYYNRNNSNLEHIYTFSCEDVVGIKIKKK